MKLICPYCSRKFKFEEGVRTKIMIELAGVGARFGECFLLAFEYTESFANQKHGAITAAKRLRVFKELAKLWESCIFEYDGKRYRTDKSKIIVAMRTVCDADKHGFKNHNYLKRVLLESSERLSAEGLTAKEENRREEDKKSRRSEGLEEDERMSPEALKQFKENLGVSKISDLIGRDRKATDDRGQTTAINRSRSLGAEK